MEKLKEAEAAPLTPIVVRNNNGGTESADPPTTGASANAPSAAMPSEKEESVTEPTIAIEAKSPAASIDRLSSSAIKDYKELYGTCAVHKGTPVGRGCWFCNKLLA